MQPFDALSIRAVLQEAKPLLINRKVDRIYQLGRDEILISLRSKGGTVSLFLSAQSVYGRMCLVKIPNGSDSGDKADERYQSKHTTGAPPSFCLMLRKHLTGATLVGVEQIPGERIIDCFFSATDEVGNTAMKVLTAEIMGRHSNLIFWDKETGKIITSSHAVTREMSRQREVLPNLKYERPPGQERPSIFAISESDFKSKFEDLRRLFTENKIVSKAALREPAAVSNTVAHSSIAAAMPSTESGDKPMPVTYEQWLIAAFTGMGKHLSEEVVAGAGLTSTLSESLDSPLAADKLWRQIAALQLPVHYKPAVQADLSRYTVLGWHSDYNDDNQWKKFPSVNDMVEQYFRALEAREQFIQLREKIKAEINSESSRLESRRQVAAGHLSAEGEIERLKKSGDSILSHLHAIKAGQTELTVEDWSQEPAAQMKIELNPNLSPSQNAQAYYRQYAKLRSRQGAAQSTLDEVLSRLSYLNQLKSDCESAKDIHALRKIKDTLGGRKPIQERQAKGDSRSQQQRTKGGGNLPSGGKSKNITLTSSDGWTIFVGRNRMENDHLLNKVANPNDIWLHVLGQGGAHVLIRVPSNKQEPPKSTIEEAAQMAARLSKAGTGTKARVVYTQCKYVKKTDANKPGLVRYENERTIEVDTAKPMPKFMKKLFN